MKIVKTKIEIQGRENCVDRKMGKTAVMEESLHARPDSLGVEGLLREKANLCSHRTPLSAGRGPRHARQVTHPKGSRRAAQPKSSGMATGA